MQIKNIYSSVDSPVPLRGTSWLRCGIVKYVAEMGVMSICEERWS